VPTRAGGAGSLGGAGAVAAVPLQDADHSPAMIADVHILSFGPRGRLPAGAWLSGLTRAR